MKPLVIIPARGGSKGIPGKNIKAFCGKPLIDWTIDAARGVFLDEDICVSTDDIAIKRTVEEYGLKVPFLRPAELATDSAGTYGVLLHALDYYAALGREYDTVVLLQATSPFRNAKHLQQALSLYSQDVDMVVSVREAPVNPYNNCYEEMSNGYLQISKSGGSIIRRQESPKVYSFNGALYIINTQSLRKGWFSSFSRIVKFVMDEYHSVDLDTPIDWLFAELLVKEGYISL